MAIAAHSAASLRRSPTAPAALVGSKSAAKTSSRLPSERRRGPPKLGRVDVRGRTGVLLCLLAVTIPAGAAGCGSTHSGRASESSAEAAERGEEEEQKKEESAELAKNREILSQIEAKKREEDAE